MAGTRSRLRGTAPATDATGSDGEAPDRRGFAGAGRAGARAKVIPREVAPRSDVFTSFQKSVAVFCLRSGARATARVSTSSRFFAQLEPVRRARRASLLVERSLA